MWKSVSQQNKEIAFFMAKSALLCLYFICLYSKAQNSIFKPLKFGSKRSDYLWLEVV